MKRNVVVLMTCFNRREQSVVAAMKILEHSSDALNFRIVAVDDGSTDGTGDALRLLGDDVTVLNGNGTLFWSGGMRLASEYATRNLHHDYVLWINDDLTINADLLGNLMAEIDAVDLDDCVLVGRVLRSPEGPTTYGRRVQAAKNPLSFELAGRDEAADAFNGNFVLFGATAYSELGGFPAGYRHGYSDLVMGLRASRQGIAIREFSRWCGINNANPLRGRHFDPAVPTAARWKHALSVFGLPPGDHFRFCREVVGTRRSLYWFVRSYFRVAFPMARDSPNA